MALAAGILGRLDRSVQATTSGATAARPVETPAEEAVDLGKQTRQGSSAGLAPVDQELLLSGLKNNEKIFVFATLD